MGIYGVISIVLTGLFGVCLFSIIAVNLRPQWMGPTVKPDAMTVPVPGSTPVKHTSHNPGIDDPRNAHLLKQVGIGPQGVDSRKWLSEAFAQFVVAQNEMNRAAKNLETAMQAIQREWDYEERKARRERDYAASEQDV